MFQSRPSLLAQPLIRLSAFKPSVGEDKIEFALETKMEKEKKGEGQVAACLCVCVCVCLCILLNQDKSYGA